MFEYFNAVASPLSITIVLSCHVAHKSQVVLVKLLDGYNIRDFYFEICQVLVWLL